MSSVFSSAIDSGRVAFLIFAAATAVGRKSAGAAAMTSTSAARQCVANGVAICSGALDAQRRARRAAARPRAVRRRASRRRRAATPPPRSRRPSCRCCDSRETAPDRATSRVGPAVTSTRRPASAPRVSSMPPDVREDALGLRHASRARALLRRRQRPGLGIEHRVAERAQVRDVAPRSARCAHMRSFIAGTSSTGASAASRHAVSRSSARPAAARERKSAVAGATTISAAAARQLDVIERVPFGDELRVHRAPGERLERHGADELTGRLRQHHVHFGAGLREQPRQPRRLVTRDSPSDAEENAPALVGAHGCSIRGGVVEERATPTGGAARRDTRSRRPRALRARGS